MLRQRARCQLPTSAASRVGQSISLLRLRSTLFNRAISFGGEMASVIIKILVSNLLTLYYTIKMLLAMGLYAATHPFSTTWTPKLRLLPPEIMKHPKFGLHKYVKANNVKIHYVESGDSSKPLIVFVHGYPEFWYTWRHQITEFNKDYWCIAIDMRGYGDSEKPERQSAYKLHNLVEDIRDLIRQMGREKFILVAHDWGGGVGWRYRDIYPETLLAYVSICSSSLWALNKLVSEDAEQFQRSWYILMYRAPWVPEMIMSFNNLAILEEMLRPDKNNANVTEEDVECYKFTFGKPGAFTPPINYYRENFSYSQVPAPPVRDQSVPCLFVHAENDQYLVPKNAEIVSAHYERCETIVLKGVGHFCPQENPEIVNPAIKNFLKKHNL